MLSPSSWDRVRNTFRRFRVTRDLVKKRILNDEKLNVGLVASTAEVAGLFSVQSGCFHEVEAAVILNRVSNLGNNNVFIFLSHFA